MRWDKLFDDLESQLEMELGAEELDLVAEEERLRLGRLTLRDRLVALARETGGTDAGAGLRVELRDGETWVVRPTAVGRDWFAGELEGVGAERTSAVVPIGALASVVPSADQLARSIRPEPPVEQTLTLSARLGLTFVLRDLCRRRSAVEVHTDAARHHGTIDRVGRDHLDLAEHEPGVARRDSDVSRLRIIPIERLVLLRF